MVTAVINVSAPIPTARPMPLMSNSLLAGPRAENRTIAEKAPEQFQAEPTPRVAYLTSILESVALPGFGSTSMTPWSGFRTWAPCSPPRAPSARATDSIQTANRPTIGGNEPETGRRSSFGMLCRGVETHAQPRVGAGRVGVGPAAVN